MSGWTSPRWLNRFLRNRGLTLAVALALFLGWIFLAGFLLWQVKVKEEFSCLASLNIPAGTESVGGADNHHLELRMFEGLNPPILTSLRPGDEIDLRVGEQEGQAIHLRTRLVGLEGGDGFPALLLKPINSGGGALKAYRTLFGQQPVRLSVGLRSKRLLQVALERSPFPK